MADMILAAGAEDIVFSKDGKSLFVAMADGTLRSYATDTHALVQSISVGSKLGAMSLSDDGETLLIIERAPLAGVSRVYRVDVETGRVVAFDLPGEMFKDVQFVGNVRAIATGGQSGPQMIDTQTGSFSSVPNSVEYSDQSILTRSGRYTLLAEQGISSGPLMIFDGISGVVISKGDNYQPGAESGFNNGQEVVSENRGVVAQFAYHNSINLFDLNLKFIANIVTSGVVDGISFDGAGKFLYYHDLDTGFVHKLETTNWTEVGSFFVDQGHLINRQSTGSELLIAPGDRTIALRDASNGDLHIAPLASATPGVTITGSAGNDLISALRAPAGQPRATAGDDVIYGLAGNDMLDGAGGADTMHGGAGNDTFTIGESFDQAIELAGEGTDTMKSAVADLALSANVEKGLLTGALNLDITGNELANILTGNAGANRLFGGDGKDTLLGKDGDDHLRGGNGDDVLDGGVGRDTASYAKASAAVIVDLNRTVAQVTGAGKDRLVSIENLEGSDFNDTLIGNGVANSLTGGLGNDRLEGGAGDDTFVGGAGDDRLIGGTGNDTVDYTDAWFDDLQVSLDAVGAQDTGVGLDILEGIENLIGAQGNDILIGNNGINLVVGAAGNDYIEGRAGQDRLEGGDGDDIIDGGGEDDVVVGGSGVDRLYGGYGADRLLGEDGDDYLGGGSGDDIVDGGDGRDFAIYLDALEGVVVDLNRTDAQDVNTGTRHTFISIEGLIGSFHADTLVARSTGSAMYGDEGDDRLIGGAGNDYLNGGNGVDTADFGLASDGVYLTLRGPSTSSVALGAGSDDLISIENILGSEHRDVVVGDSSTNRLEGRAGDDALSGGDGDDVLIGGLGADTLLGGNGWDIADYSAATTAITVALPAFRVDIGGQASDTVGAIEEFHGGAANDQFIGDATGNLFRGNGGADNLLGGLGADMLFGGSGADLFRYTAANHSTLDAAGRDTIGDFSGFGGEGDRIALAAIDADGNSTNGDQAFLFIGAANFSNAVRQLRYAFDGGNTLIEADTNGDGLADLAITLSDNVALTVADFIL